MKAKDITFRRFGRWIALRRVVQDDHGIWKWLCKCDCGNSKAVSSQSLLRGGSKSCGCLNDEVRANRWKTHGMSGTPEHNTWENMKERCYNPGNHRFEDYGGRGILICKRWQKFENFYKDMGKRPIGTSLGRIDNNKGYCPSNCRWETREQQQRNRKTNHLITYKGKTLCITEWAEKLGFGRSALNARLFRGWSLTRAFKTPIFKKNNNGKAHL